LHIDGLNEIKNLFEQLSNSTNLKDIQNYVPNITKLCKKQNITYSRYSSIIRDYPEAKVNKSMIDIEIIYNQKTKIV